MQTIFSIQSWQNGLMNCGLRARPVSIWDSPRPGTENQQLSDVPAKKRTIVRCMSYELSKLKTGHNFTKKKKTGHEFVACSKFMGFQGIS
jgi:hypothetical protein